MSLAYIVRFRVNRANYERLIQDARSLGFTKVADYIRHHILGPTLHMETLLKENNALLKEIRQHLREKSKG